MADAQVPAGIARDTEITSGALQPGDITAGMNVTITTTTDGLTINAAGGGGGGGTGDITAVTTGGNSGLAGGANSGAADLEFDPNNLQTHTVVDSGDLFPFADVSGTGRAAGQYHLQESCS